MKQEIFINELESRLEVLSRSEREKAVNFYNELIADRMENGEEEEEVVSGLGSAEQIAETILKENNKGKPNQGMSKKEKLFLVIGSPIWIPLLFVALVAVAVVFILWGLTVVVLFAISASLGVVYIVGFPSSFVVMTHSGVAGAFQLGVSLVALGLCILLFLGTFRFAKIFVQVCEFCWVQISNFILVKILKWRQNNEQ